MFCTKCGIELPEANKFCSSCGTPTAKAPVLPWDGFGSTRLRLPRKGRKLLGVCAAIAKYLNVDVTVVRIVAVLLLFWPIPVVLGFAYVIAYAVMPEEPLELAQPAASAPASAAPSAR